MSNDTYLSAFPANPAQALAMEYVKNQDLSNLSPREITALYFDTFKEIRLAMNSATRDKDGFFKVEKD
ncbi:MULTISPECIES: hypothetical protein [Lactiplantibacillus]|uniref:hypothetical protein n=1 Tax=Lactiplantibacillus TaxID=2767842 RepID=UPI0004643902|nr:MULTISPECIES: hypothetical protein [Lactiplantibacillus]MBO2713170.1 hypothetical protein [Lactiplantibacillus plantarum]